MPTNQLLIVVTNVGEYETVGYRTGLWLGELTHFWDVAEEAGYRMDIASPKGGYIPIDPESLAATVLKEGGVDKRYEDRQFMNLLEETKRVTDVGHESYDAIYLTGGHGVCYDFPKSAELAQLIAQFFESQKIVSAVCHGPAGLLEVRLSDGKHLLDGRKVTGFSWAEEIKVGRDNAVPYNLEDELKIRGAHYEKAWLTFASHVVTDGLLITGQNPASAAGVGKAVVKALKGD